MSMTKIFPRLPLIGESLIKKFFNASHRLAKRKYEADALEETPAMLAAIDEGIHSLEQQGAVPIEVVRARFEEKWATR